ncbi:DUF6790 family protein [Pseudomonas nitroreducens]|uniref:DUF6790 family protein n=1 Tax=Pseudomonas nitroreducens TaxID=46680 RepID=UPI0037FED2A1
MYYFIVTLLTVALPFASIALERLLDPQASLLLLLGKWFVFWGIGARLLLAGLMQVRRPGFTAREILGIEAPAAEKLVSELGFANLAFGITGLLSLALPGWTPPAALAGGLFLLLAGLKHARNPQRNGKEHLAMATDLFVAAMAVAYLIGLLLGAGR